MLIWLEGHTASKILIPLQSLILVSRTTKQAGGSGCSEGLWQGLLPSVSKALLSAALGAVAQAGEGVPLSLIFFVPRIRPMKIVSTGQVADFLADYEGDSSACFLLRFPPVLQLLSVCATAYKILGRSSSFLKGRIVFETVYLRIWIQTHVAETLCYA